MYQPQNQPTTSEPQKTGIPSLFGEGKNAFTFTRNALTDRQMKHKMKE